MANTIPPPFSPDIQGLRRDNDDTPSQPENTPEAPAQPQRQSGAPAERSTDAALARARMHQQARELDALVHQMAQGESPAPETPAATPTDRTKANIPSAERPAAGPAPAPTPTTAPTPHPTTLGDLARGVMHTMEHGVRTELGHLHHTQAPSLRSVEMGTARLKMGERGPAVTQLQRMLGVKPTGAFDNATRVAVTKFQAEHGMLANGQVDRATLKAIEKNVQEHLAPSLEQVAHGLGTLHEGQYGSSVEDLQKMLGMEPTGVFDQATREQVSQFQAQHGLNPSGAVDKSTLKAIEKEFRETAPSLEQIQDGAAKLEPGQHGPAVSHIQQLLGLKQTGVYDAATQIAVKKFQAKQGLRSTTGEVGEATLGAMELAGHPAAPSLSDIEDGKAKLQPGQAGPAVEDVQRLLGLRQTGVYDAATEAAVRQFQAGHGLHSTTGEVGTQTLQAMEAAHWKETSGEQNLYAQLSSPNSPLSVAIGCAEGTRTRDGGYTSAYEGHTDPGNSKHNVGTFSYQHSCSSPQDADRQQLAKMRDLIPQYEAAALKAGLDPSNPLLQASFFDLYNQAPEAAVGKEGFLDKGMAEIAKSGAITPESVARARGDCFYDPKTHKLDTTFSSKEALLNDQLRREDALKSVVGGDSSPWKAEPVISRNPVLSGTAKSEGLAGKIQPFQQHTSWTCGYACVAMVANAATGKHIDDRNMVDRYGTKGGLQSMLNDQCRDAADPKFRKWHDYGDLKTDKDWQTIANKVNHGSPVLMGLNGQFSASGHGHVVLLTHIDGNRVTYADPATGEMRETTREAIMNCKPHPDGKFIISTES